MADEHPKTFISYCTKDTELARRLKEDLSRAGCDSWQFDLSAIPGTDAWNSILERIEKSDFFIVLLSIAATKSKAVQEEISHAHYCSIQNPEGRPRIIPLIIENDVAVPRQIVRAVRLLFRETHYNSDFEHLLKSLGVERSPFSEATALDVTFSRGREFDAGREAAIYAANLIRNNPDVARTFDSLSADVQREAAGRWSMPDAPNAQVIVWKAETWRDSVQPQWVRKSEYVFLVFFALHAGYHTGYSTEKRVVLEITASQEIKYNHVGEELVLDSDTLRLKFAGFRNVTALPL